MTGWGMVHRAAATGFQRESETYAKARPSYHPSVLDRVAAGIGAGIVLDVGAGTGISTKALVERGLDVIAVEPVEAMRAQLQAALPNVQAIEGTAESLPVPDGSARAIVVAQAFHWFDHGPALDEIVRVLTTGGLLITLWNVRDESVPWMAAYTAIQDRVQGDTPRYRDMTWRSAIESDGRFTLVEEPRVANPQPSHPDHTVARFLSTSFVASLEHERQAKLATEIRAMVSDLGDSYDFPYISEAQIWQLDG